MLVSAPHLDFRMMLAIVKELGLDALADEMKKAEGPPAGDWIYQLSLSEENRRVLQVELEDECRDEFFVD